MTRRVHRVGIIGAGAAARMHLRALLRIKSLQVVCICDLEKEKASRLAAEFGLSSEVAVEAGSFYEYGPQSVHVVTPPATHEDLSFEALEHGCHVLVEKPPALTLAGCQRLLSEAAARHLSIGVSENTACEPLLLRARAMIEARQLGRVLQIDGHYCFGLLEGEYPPPWASELPGGMLEDLLPHLLTTARALAGHRLVPEHWRVARTGTRREPRGDELRLLLTANNVSVNLTLSLTARPKAFALAVRGTTATLVVDLRNLLLCVTRPTASGGAVAVGCELVRSASSVLWQTASNAAGIITGYIEPHGSFLPLICSHYVALQGQTEEPAPLARAAETTAIVERIWPFGRGREPKSPVHLDAS